MSPDAPVVRHAQTDADIRSTFDVMLELRPHLEREVYLEAVRRMAETDGYRLAFVEADGKVQAAAGYRPMELLYAGRILQVDDLVVSERARSARHGTRLLDAIFAEARADGRVQVHLDSGVWRDAAHRFYFRERFRILGYHFVADVSDSAPRRS